MFGLFKRDKPEPVPNEPIKFSVSIEIDAPPEAVYPLLDFGDERHHLRARGNEIRQVESDPPVYRLWYDLAPDLNFLFAVDQAVPGSAYSYSAMIVPPVGLRTGAHEAYALEHLEDGGCKLTFVNTIHHVPGIRPDDLSREIAMSSEAAASALTKLKIQAELGVEAVEEFEREMGHR